MRSEKVPCEFPDVVRRYKKVEVRISFQTFLYQIVQLSKDPFIRMCQPSLLRLRKHGDESCNVPKFCQEFRGCKNSLFRTAEVRTYGRFLRIPKPEDIS